MEHGKQNQTKERGEEVRRDKMKKKEASVDVKVIVDTSEIDKCMEKLSDLEQKIQELNTDATELNSCISGINLKINIQF